MVGVSHTTTPVEVRERLAFSAGELPSALARLNGWAPEGVILSTCSRTEIYAVVNESSAEPKQFLSAERPSAGAASLEERWGEEATRHLFRVASGLESIALGEPQILGQIKRALETANEAGTCGLVLSRLFRQAIEVGKRVRSQTSIGTKAPSLARMALDLASTDSRADSLLQLLVVGSGHMGKLAALSAADRASFDVVIVSRNSAAARKLADRVGGRARPFSALHDELALADVALSCTSAPQHVISRRLVEAAMRKRAGSPLVLIDLAVPRDIEPACREVAGVTLFDMDQLPRLAGSDREFCSDMARAAGLVDQEVLRFQQWSTERTVVPTVAALVGRAEAIRAAEVQKFIGRLGHLSQRDHETVYALSSAIVNKLLHGPIVSIKQRAQASDTFVPAVRELFELDLRS
ncbi:MAG TPA: glutamyl-tRNA reductase [Chloroflexota bacterium]|nr:glutamyl-tRNA reductase [Chloroflexota bacterium]